MVVTAQSAENPAMTPEFLSFLSSLATIVVIDLVLAGDNAIVIALATRSLPRPLQRRAILWGSLGAVAVRVALTVGVLALLDIPALSVAGGLLLVWVAYQLLVGEETGGSGRAIAPAAGFWRAMRTIVVADLVMGLDNVVAVAGAAHGDVLLVVLGLAISIPIVVWGSTLILRFIERFPALLYFGGAVLAWTAAAMIEPLYADWMAAHPGARPLPYVLIVVGVLAAAWLRKRATKALSAE
jgi:YjbE family integral membrane protein